MSNHLRFHRRAMGRRKMTVVIALKGHPGTGKTTLGRAISGALHSPLLDKDDIKDCTQPLLAATSSHVLNDLSYSVLFRLAETQLSLGLSLVIDSPLSRPAHFQHLVDLANTHGARVLIVECRPADEAEWRRRLEARAASCPGGGASSHKPASWGELRELVAGYEGCFDYDTGGAAKLVVDTTAVAGIDDAVSAVLQFVDAGNLPANGVIPA